MRTLEKRMRAATVALVMSSIATWVGGQVAHAQSTSSSPPPTLNGETFATANPNNGGNPNSTQCNSDGSGTFTYSASGTATGPYNGTFTETGTVTTDSSRNIIASSAHFTITSAQGTVTGSETIAPNSPLGTCGGIQPTGDSFIKSQDNYQATIATPSGNYLDQGNFSKLVVVLANAVGFTDLNEQFNSSQTQTTLIVPTSKNQCKDDGWKNYPQFKNQGQCVSSVNHQ